MHSIIIIAAMQMGNLTPQSIGSLAFFFALALVSLPLLSILLRALLSFLLDVVAILVDGRDEDDGGASSRLLIS